MISLTLFKREMKANNKLLIIFIYILTIYILSIVYMFNPNSSNAFDDIIKSMPGIMKAFGFVASGNTLIGFIATDLYGMILLMFPVIFSIILGNKLIAGYVDRGSMAYLLATPNKRVKLALTQALCLWVSIGLLITYATVAIIISSSIMHPGLLEIGKLVLMNVVIYFLHIAISGICFFASCISNDTKRSFTIGAGIPIAFFLIQMLANMGGKLENLKYFTLFTLFNANDIIAGKNVVFPVIILAIVGIALYGIGIYIFSKRDLPV
ncbi:ABC transporter permease [Clostridium estertheticum]|uniref:ABC transporter permease subunit n=1 Tax=Clostridium estertheticum TaxID=238834 RepID=UPI0013E984B8|nr:ABC transporter permease subunit [Clostridium estertheticum]MBZ9686924.1 ABC transporter permease [Clostridium estertheticum]